jgi:cell division protein FtsN
MTDTDRELGLQDEDRLPWLEAVESDDDDEGLSGSKLLGFLLAAVLALGLVVGGVTWLRSQQQGPTGDGTLIAAQEGDYKVKPSDPGGMKVEGQGDASFAASEGGEANGKVDMNAKPETPVAAAKKPDMPATKPVVAATKAVTTAVPAASAKMPTPAIPAPAVTGTNGLVQLGAYGSQVGADQAWATLAGKVPGMSGMSKSVLPAAVGGSTVYRLRAQAGTPEAASALCAKAKAAGTPCMVVR